MSCTYQSAASMTREAGRSQNAWSLTGSIKTATLSRNICREHSGHCGQSGLLFWQLFVALSGAIGQAVGLSRLLACETDFVLAHTMQHHNLASYNSASRLLPNVGKGLR